MKKRYKDLEQKIINTYESGVTLEDAESLAAAFLAAQIEISQDLATSDLDAKMKKSGLKAIRAAGYLDTVSVQEKKPTEGMITAVLDSDKTIIHSQDMLDSAETSRDELKRLYDIFNNAHIYYRGIAKGRFE